MEKLLKYTDIVFLFGLLAIPFMPNFGALDIIGPQFLYLSILLFSYVAIKLLTKQKVDFKLNYSTFFYLLFFITALLSIFNSLNKIESLIELIRYFITFLILVFTFSIFNNKKTIINSVIIAIVAFLFIETFYIFYLFIKNYSFEIPPLRLREFEGFAYNQNIASLSILVKIPLALFAFIKTKNKIIRFFLGILIAISTFDILIIGSRSAIYGLFLLIICLIGLIVFIKRFNFDDVNRKKLLKVLLIFFSVFILQNILYTNSKNNLQAVDRVKILDDYSTNYRLDMWEYSFEMLKDFPLFGVGIGNWKIQSIKYGKNHIKDYEVPYHAHNDFVQMFSEVGILGGLFFILFFISPIYFLFKNYKSFSNSKKELSIFLLFSLGAIIIDSFFNFPRARPYSLLNLFWVITLIYTLGSFKIENTNKFWSNTFLLICLILCIPSIYILYRVKNSLVEQVPLIVEYNEYPDQIITPVSEILLFEEQIPNITNVVMPLKIVKARYLLMEEKYDSAKKLIKEGRIHNPYLGFGDVLLGRIYLKENKLDSAAFYGKRSLEKLPINASHITRYQIILERQQNLEESEKVFIETMSLKVEAIWQNYLITVSTIKVRKDLDFTDREREFMKQGIEMFPNNTVLQQADKIINYGGDLILLANEFDSKATKNFDEKKYQDSIDNWLKAIDIISNDEAYYLNIAHAYLLKDENNNAQKYFNIIKKENLIGITGKYEFLKSIYYLNLNKTNKACDFAVLAKDKGYSNAQVLLDQLKCIN